MKILNSSKFLLSLVALFTAQQLGFAQSQSFDGGYSLSLMACQNGNVYQAGSISGTSTFTIVPKGEQTGNATAFLNKINQVNGGSGSHALALACDGSVFAWGGNANGQLGNNTTTTSPTPVRVRTGLQGSASGYLENVKFVAGGDLSSYALLNDGRVMAWGSNGSGRLGDGSTIQRNTPVFVKTDATTQLTNIVQVYGGEVFAVALDSDGHVWVWGGDIHKESQGTASSFAKLILKADGTPLSNIVRISGGDTHVLALDVNGVLWSWGGNWERQLGDGLAIDDAFPKPVIAVGETYPTTNYLKGVVNFSAGAFMSVAVLDDGRVVGWGTNRDNSNGTGTSTNVPKYILNSAGTLPIDNIVDVATGDRHGFMVDGNGQLYMWGWNADGQLGIGSTTNQNYPQPVTMPCNIRTPCPVARLGPDVTLCNPISDELYAGSIAPYFAYAWYKNGVLLPNDTSEYLSVNTPGTYKVIITDTSAVTTCSACPAAEDEIIISTSSVEPINANFCAPAAKNVTLAVDNPGTTFNWYAASSGGSPLAGGSNTNTYVTPAISTTTTYYVEDTRTYSYLTGYTPTETAYGAAQEGWSLNDPMDATFTVIKSLTLISVDVFKDLPACAGTIPATLQIVGGITTTYAGTINCSGLSTFPINAVLAPGTYRLEWVTGMNDVRYFGTGANPVPFPIGVPGLISLKNPLASGIYSSGSFFNWNVSAVTNCARVPVIANHTGACPLPVELLNFQAEKINTAAYITWQTSVEKNSWKFQIERSLDGVNFNSIGTVHAAGNSNSIVSYQFMDNHLGDFNSYVFYRLKQVDVDGSFEYSNVVTLNNSSENVFLIKVMPNPIQKGEQLHLAILSGEEREVYVNLYDAVGKQIYSASHKVISGNNDLSIDMGNLSSGLYIMEVNLENQESEKIKLIVE